MTNTVGFKGFRKTEDISDDALATALSRLSTSNLYVYNTGGVYKLRSASLRSNSLRTITEVKTPVPVEELIRRAARISGNIGYNPATVKSGLYLHRNSKPAVYMALERKEDGSFVAAADTPYPDGFPALKRGDVVLTADAKEAREVTKALAVKNKALKTRASEVKSLAAPEAPKNPPAAPPVISTVRKGRKALANA